MHKLEPPFLEIGFYFADLSDADAFAKVAKTILARGARFVSAKGWQGAGERERPFAGPADDRLPQPLHLRPDQLEAALAERDLRVTELQLDPIIGVSRSPEVLEYETISEEAAQIDHHPINVLAEGHAYSGPHEPERGWKPGKKIYGAFRELVLALTPSYACINVEAPTRCPTDLLRTPSGFSRDFWISETFLGSDALTAISRLFDGAHQERFGNGLYVSTYRYWNPARVDFDRTRAAYLSSEVGKLVAQHRPTRTRN